MAEVSVGTDYSASDYTAGPAQRRYSQLCTDRESFLRRGRAASRLTIPHLLPEAGATGSTDEPTPYQGIGARGVNNLASKLTLALFPPGGSFFRSDLDRKLKQEAAKAFQDTSEIDAIGEIDKALRQTEDTVMDAFEAGGARPVMYRALKHTIVTGNMLIYVEEDESLCAYRLDRYVVKRDQKGKEIEIVLCIPCEVASLDPELREHYDSTNTSGPEQDGIQTSAYVNLYTHIKRGPKSWVVYQEMRGKEVEDTRGNYPLDKSPWIPLRFNASEGEDYGRGLVEEYAGDLSGLESLSQALIEGSLAAARVLFFTDEAGTTKAEDIAKADNLAVLEGRATDVSTLKLDKYPDFAVAKTHLDTIEQRLSKSFLENTSVQRQAERVTAEEIAFLAQELEDALGGVYSLFSKELQYPLAQRYIYQLGKKKKLPKLPANAMKISITTGIEALGRGADLRKLDTLVQGTAEFLGQEAVAEYVKGGSYIARRASALGVNIDGLIRTEQEVAQSRQAAQIHELAGKVAPNAVKAVSDQMTQANQTQAQ